MAAVGQLRRLGISAARLLYPVGAAGTAEKCQ